MPASPDQSARISRSLEDMNAAARWRWDDLPLALRVAFWVCYITAITVVSLALGLALLRLAIILLAA